jgi:hypothetical protein
MMNVKYCLIFFLITAILTCCKPSKIVISSLRQPSSENVFHLKFPISPRGRPIGLQLTTNLTDLQICIADGESMEYLISKDSIRINFILQNDTLRFESFEGKIKRTTIGQFWIPPVSGVDFWEQAESFDGGNTYRWIVQPYYYYVPICTGKWMFIETETTRTEFYRHKFDPIRFEGNCKRSDKAGRLKP